MLESFAVLLLALPAGDDATEIQRSITKFELSAEADGDRFESATIGAPAREVAWRRGRATFELDEAPQAGHWLLGLGGPGLALDATVNGHHLDPIADAFGDSAQLRAGPRFDVAAEALVAGTNRIDLVFKGERLGRGFEEGPALLLSPEPSALLRAAATAHDLFPVVANLSTLATAGKNGVLLDRVAFRTAPDGSHRLAAQLAFSVVGPDDREIPVGELESRQATPLFPVASLALTEKRIDRFNARFSTFAPLVPADLGVSRTKAVQFDVAQIIQGEAATFRWRVRLFPALGGALHVVRDDGLVMLHNGIVGVAFERAKLIGTNKEPLGLEFTLIHKPKQGPLQSMAGPSLDGVVVGFSAAGGDTSGAGSIEALATSLLKSEKTIFGGVAKLALMIPSEPFEKNEVTGLAARVAAVANLAGTRERGERSIFVPPEGPASAAAYFEDEWTLLDAPARERATIEWLLSTRSGEGAIRGDATADLPPLCELEQDCYTVLRACRWYRWTYEGDAFRAFAAGLGSVLQRAAALADAEPLEKRVGAHPAGTRRLSLFHLRCALAAAERALAEALAQLGKDEAAARDWEQRAAARIAELGKQVPASDAAPAGDDPREQAVALVFDLLEPAAAADLAKRLAETPAPADAGDWRESLLARGLLDAGDVKNGRARARALEQGLRNSATPLASGHSAYHGALLFGLLGVRRNDLGTVECLPRVVGKEQIHATVPLPEGPVKILLLSPAIDFKRQLVVQNDSSLDLMTIVGVPGGMGDGEKRKVGDSVFSLYQEIVAAHSAWRPLVR
jgi:hypothetical protein